MQAAITAAPTASDWQFFLAVGLLLGWPAMLRVTRPCALASSPPAAFEALRHLLLLEPLPDAAASLVTDTLSLWPLAQQETTLLATIPRPTLDATVSLLGVAGAILANCSRHQELVYQLCRWLRRLGATLLHPPEHFPYLADPLAFHLILSAMLRTYTPAPIVAQEQADALRPLLGGLLSHLDADPAVRARDAVLQIQLLLS